MLGEGIVVNEPSPSEVHYRVQPRFEKRHIFRVIGTALGAAGLMFVCQAQHLPEWGMFLGLWAALGVASGIRADGQRNLAKEVYRDGYRDALQARYAEE